MSCEKYDVKGETVHCYPRYVDHCCTWSEVTRCCRWILRAFFKICFRFVLLYNKSLNDLSLGEQWILCLWNHNVSRDDILGKQNSLFPSRPVIKCKMIADIIVTWPNLGIFNTLWYLFWLASVAYKARLVLPWVFWLNYVSPKYGLWLVQTRLTCRWRVQKRYDLVRY